MTIAAGGIAPSHLGEDLILPVRRLVPLCSANTPLAQVIRLQQRPRK